MNTLLSTIKSASKLSLILLVLCGVLYPAAVTAIGQTVFPHQSNGSLIQVDNKVIGSEVVGQQFSSLCYLKSRPSAVNYNVYTEEMRASGDYAGISTGSKNYGPSNPALVERVSNDMKTFLAEHPELKASDIPTDLLTASGSGLDPHISPESAAIQVATVAKYNGLTETQIKGFIKDNTKQPLLGIFGEATVNVLKVNIEIYKAMNHR